jgi:hypothetical protein
MNDFFTALKAEELLQKKLKKLRKENKTKKANIFITLKTKNKSNSTKLDTSNFSAKINSNNIHYTNDNKKQTNLKISIKENETSNSNSNSLNTSTSAHIGSSHSSGSKTYSLKNDFSYKKGVVINKQSVVLKTNFEMSGRMNKKGLRPTSKQIGTHTSASLNYMENHGAKDLENSEELSNIYDKEGELILKNELEQIKKDLNDGVQGFRRTMIDVGQKEFDRDDLNKLVRESLQSLQERTGKSFEYNYAIHTNTEHIHAHVLSYGKNSDINLTKEQLQMFKQIIGDKTQEILLEKELEIKRDKDLGLEKGKNIGKNLDNKNELSL